MNPFLTSRLFDEKTFYQAFLKDLEGCRSEVIIESPYITAKRAEMLIPIFENLAKRRKDLCYDKRSQGT